MVLALLLGGSRFGLLEGACCASEGVEPGNSAMNVFGAEFGCCCCCDEDRLAMSSE